MKDVYHGPTLTPKPYPKDYPIWPYRAIFFFVLIFILYVIYGINMGLIAFVLFVLYTFIILSFYYIVEKPALEKKKQLKKQELEERKVISKKLKNKPFCPKCKSVLYPCEDKSDPHGGRIMACGRCDY